MCRVLQDNPDVDGNQRKIKSNKTDLMSFLEELMLEMRELTYQQARGTIKSEIEG